MIDVRKLLESGFAALARKRAEKEVAVAGHPRVGSAGCVTEGEVYGVCHRIAHARQIGIEKEVDLSTRLMWAMGEANEDVWEKVLAASDFRGRVVSHQEIDHKIDGVNLSVLGHPDKILEAEDGSRLGLELKGIFGYSTAVQVFYEGVPKNENLIQAAAYSHFLNIPFALWYASGSWVGLKPWDKKAYGDSSIRPFYKGFHLDWRGQELWYRAEDRDQWTPTVITKTGIEDYYRLLQEMADNKDLGPRVNSNYVNGTPNKWGVEASCGLCEFSTACAQYDGDRDYQAWLDSITVLCQGD